MPAPKPMNLPDGASVPQKLFHNFHDERQVLRLSVLATLVVALAGIALGLVSGSFSIMFDGVYSLVDASMSLLSLLVVNLIVSYRDATGLPHNLRERFTMGFWHLEPMVLALNGTLLMGVAAYALVNAIGSLVDGGRAIEFGPAIVYAAFTVVFCGAIALLEARANKAVQSEFLRLDIKGWIMTTGISAALLLAFLLGMAVEGTPLHWISPYIDPAALALICLVIIPLPISIVRKALADMFLVTPQDLKQHVDSVAGAFVARHGFLSYSAYVARVGRAKEIELTFLVPKASETRPLSEWDRLRDEIGSALGGDKTDRWLTISFTNDPAWAD